MSVYFMSVNPGAPTPHQLMAALWLSDRGYSVVCIIPGGHGEDVFTRTLGRVTIDAVTAGRRLRLWWHLKFAIRILSRRITAGPNDIFYVHGSQACPASSLALLGVPSRKLIYHSQDYLEPGRHPHWEFFERRVSRRAGAVISNEPARARFMTSHYRLKKVPIVVRTALPSTWPIPERDQSTRSYLLSCAGKSEDAARCLIWAGGSPSPTRCSESLMRAVARLPQRYALIFSGGEEGAPNAVAAASLAHSLGIGDRTVFLGQMRFEQMLRHAAACDVGVLLYPDDGVGNYFQCPGRMTEYMACGLPFVASDFPGLELAVVKYGLGVVCDPSSPEQIAAALETLGNRSADLATSERVRLRRLARTEFAYETQANRIEHLLHNLTPTTASGQDRRLPGP